VDQLPYMLLEKLKNISLSILQSRTLDEETTAAKQLSDFYQELVKLENIEISKTNESALQGGLALSTYDAAICVDEHLRTTRFIKGVYEAIQTLSKNFPQQKINILYAGCGPYGTLVLPLLPLLDAQRFNITFLDFHTPSLQSVTQVLRTIGLNHFPIQMVEANALEYQAAQPLHLVVTETMYKALIREPQTGITQNLAPQLITGGILVPESINIDLVYTFVGKEPDFESKKQPAIYKQEPYPHRKVIDRLFSLNKKTVFFEENKENKFLSKVYTLPHEMENTPDISVFTSINVFQDIQLNSSQSTITNPHSISSSINYAKGSTFQLEYVFDGIPKWEIITNGK